MIFYSFNPSLGSCAFADAEKNANTRKKDVTPNIVADIDCLMFLKNCKHNSKSESMVLVYTFISPICKICGRLSPQF